MAFVWTVTLSRSFSILGDKYVKSAKYKILPWKISLLQSDTGRMAWVFLVWCRRQLVLEMLVLSSQVEFFCELYKPEILIREQEVSVGRVHLMKKQTQALTVQR